MECKSTVTTLGTETATVRAGDIRNFTDCTEVLQGDVVKVVNGIAEYVHEATRDNFGAVTSRMLLGRKGHGRSRAVCCRVHVTQYADRAVLSRVTKLLRQSH
eukprot:2336165-Rhodomonas_salina.1